MSLQLFTNNAISLLQTGISATSTEIQLQPGQGNLFPLPSAPGEYFLVTLETVDPPFIREIVKVTGRSGDTLTGCVRGQEGTSPLVWSALSTLVDHRVTAQTMRDAMLLPEQGVLVKDSGVLLPDRTTTLNFGNGLTVTGTGTEKTISVPGGGAGGWISGESTSPVLIDPSWNLVINTVEYAQYNRGFKFLITILSSTGRTQSFEALANIDGILDAVSEQVNFTRYNRVGYNFRGELTMTLNRVARQLNVFWRNDEGVPVEVQITRIQHGA